jgi:hypothetical protein
MTKLLSNPGFALFDVSTARPTGRSSLCQTRGSDSTSDE